MADNFVQFSVEVPVTGKRQRNFFHRASLKLRAELEDKGYAEAGSCDFAFTPTSVVLYSEECGEADYAAGLIRDFLKAFKLKTHIIFGVAFTCSKPRPGEFGGVAFYVDSERVECCNPEEALRTTFAKRETHHAQTDQG